MALGPPKLATGFASRPSCLKGRFENPSRDSMLNDQGESACSYYMVRYQHGCLRLLCPQYPLYLGRRKAPLGAGISS